IELVGGKARVHARIDRNIIIYKDAKANIVSTGVIGAKYLEIKIGSPKEPVLEEGETIKGISPKSMEQVIDKILSSVDGLLDAVNALTGEAEIKEGPIYKTIKNLEKITDKLNKGFGADETDIRQIVVNMRDTMKSMNRFTGNLDDLISKNKEVLQKDIESFSGSLQRIEDILSKIADFTDKATKSDSVLGQLIADEEVAEEVRETISNIKEAGENVKNITARIGTIKMEWDAKTRYNFEDKQWRVDAGVRMRPKPEKFYSVSIDNIGGNGIGKYDEGGQRTNSVTALIGRDIGDFTLYGGAMKSSGGVGLGYRPLGWKRGKLNIDAYRFSRDVDNENTPWVNITSSLMVTKWGNISIGTEDILSNNGFTSGFHFVFEDEDIAYLLGLLGLSTVTK
ncbi:MlaD family protein, partial [bacterium]